MSTDLAVIYIVDDEEPARKAVGRLLRAAGYDVSIYDSANHFLENLPTERGCILLDVQMPGMNGTKLQEILRNSGVALPIIFLTGRGDIPTSVRAIKGGAEDFLSKPPLKKLLIETIERALTRYDETHEQNVRLRKLQDLFNLLTPREREVFAIVVHGRLNKQIAHDLGTSERTIKAHRHNIMQKFKVKSFAELVLIAEKLSKNNSAADRNFQKITVPEMA